MDKSAIRVYNYGRSGIALSTKDREVYMNGMLDEIPAMETFTLAELEYINAHSPVIRSGAVEFEEAEREAVYTALKLSGWKDTCVFERDIDSILTAPTAESMERVVKIDDLQTIDRVRAHMLHLMREGNVDISNRVQTVVNARQRELNRGVRVSKIEIIPKKRVDSTSDLTKLVQEQVAAQVAAALSAAVAKAPGTTPPSADNVKAQAEATDAVKSTTKTTDRIPSKTAAKTTAKRGRPAKSSAAAATKNS